MSENQTAYLESRVRELEMKLVSQEQQVNVLQKEQDRLRTGWNRVAWAVGGSFLAALSAFVIKGGLVQ